MGFEFISVLCLPNSSNDIDNLVPINTNNEDRTFLKNLGICGAGSVEIAIDSNGDIYPCQTMIKPEFLISSIFNTNWVNEIENNKFVKELKQGVNGIDGCNECVYKYICGNGCKAVVYNLYKQLNKKNYFMCQLFKENSKDYIKNLFVK